MELKIGETIRVLRKQQGRTQENLAEALGITFQAVSRWESGLAYPDMELVPAIANYFGISIDELFGYEGKRDKMIANMVERVDAYHYKARSDDAWAEACIRILREGLAQFPKNETLLVKLADVLCEAGWRRYKEHMYYDEEGYLQHRYELHQQNPYWSECIKICERLAEEAEDPENRYAVNGILILLYRNIGEIEKAVAHANRMPPLYRCRELALSSACDGKEWAKYSGKALLTMAGHFANQVVYSLFNNLHHFESDLPIDKLQGVIVIFDLLCEDGNYGAYNGILIELYLYLARVQWERGYRDDAFESLDRAYECARALDDLCDGRERFYTAAMLCHVPFSLDPVPATSTSMLPEDFPMYLVPDCTRVVSEMKADPRWDAWVAKCKGES